MREISKYRGYDSDNKQWVYGYYTKLFVETNNPFSLDNARKAHCIIQEDDEGLTRFYIEDPETIGEGTGLKDKNGKEVYEGDILLNHNKPFWLSKNQKLIVKWQEGRFAIDPDDNSQWLKDKPQFVFERIGSGMTVIYSQDQIEVIGNIHENPELLEKAEARL